VEPDESLNEKIHNLVELVMLADWQPGYSRPAKKVEVLEEKQNDATPKPAPVPTKEEPKPKKEEAVKPQPKKDPPKKKEIPEIEEI
jgi:hypothetical protein